MNERKKQIQLAVEKFTSLECYVKECGKIKYLKQLDRFVFGETKAFKI
jgi:hypothetical protein